MMICAPLETIIQNETNKGNNRNIRKKLREKEKKAKHLTQVPWGGNKLLESFISIPNKILKQVILMKNIK